MPFRPRVIDFRSSSAINSLGLCATDLTSLLAVANEAEERLIIDPLAPEEGWWGQWAQMAFTVSQTEPAFVTPQNVARVILMGVCKHPVRINNQFYEMLQFGPGLQPKGCVNANGSPVNPQCQGPISAYERDTVTTFAPLLSTPQYIRAYVSDPSDVGRTALIQGKDANGQTIRFLDALANASGMGERITFSSPFTDTSNLFTEITGVQKAKTFGEVQIFQVDATTGAESPLMVMGPSETTASYRRYFVNGLPDRCCNSPPGTSATLQVTAMVKWDFVPLTCDSDYLNLGCIPALLDECQAIRYGRMDVPGAQQLGASKHASALRLLFGKIQNYLGNEQPAIRRSLFGSNPMRPSFR